MGVVGRDQIVELQQGISDLRSADDNWRDGLQPLVQRWAAKYMDPLPLEVHVRLLQNADTGRWYARIVLTARPLFMDVLVSVDTE